MSFRVCPIDHDPAKDPCIYTAELPEAELLADMENFRQHVPIVVERILEHGEGVAYIADAYSRGCGLSIKELLPHEWGD